MTASNPIEFLRRLTSGKLQRAGNRVQIETGDGNPNAESDPVFVELVSETGDPLSTDDITGALITITVPHHEIHEGEMFEANYLRMADVNSNLADDGTIIFFIQTGATKYGHLVFQGACGGDYQVELLEGTTIQAGTGTALTERNRNRVTGDGGNEITVIRDPTITLAGVELENLFYPGGTGGNAVGSQTGTRDEWILALNTNYMVRLTNRAGNAQPGGLRVLWYEESDI